MIIFSYLLSVIAAQQIKPSNFAVQLDGQSKTVSQDLEYLEQTQIQKYPGSILKSTINTNNTEYLCKVVHESIQLTTNFTKQIIKHDDELYTNIGDQIIGVVRQKSSLVFITEAYNYTQFDLSTLEILGTYPLNLSSSQEYQKGIYSIESDFTFLFFESSIITIDANSKQYSQNIQPLKVNEVLSSLKHIYVATDSGIVIFKIDKEINGIIYQQKIEEDQNIIDISLGGENGEILYLLKQDGIHIYKILNENNEIQLKKYSILSQIEIEYGIAFEQHNDQSFVVLVQPQKNVLFVDIEVNLEIGQWFIVSQHNLKINAKDLDINDKFAVLQGVETHNILRHSLPNIFTKIFTYYPFTLPHTINIDFYEPDLDSEQTIHTWYKNRTKNFLYGVDAYSIIIYNWENYQGELICEVNDEKYIGESYNYQFITLTTDCDEKQSYTKDIISKDLIVCEFNTEITLNVVQAVQDFQHSVLFIIILVLSGFLILMVLGFVFYRKNTKRQLDQYKEKLKKYEKFQGEGGRQNTPHPIVDSNFKIDDDE